ncbi:MAG: hypothetical protein H0X26_06780 [Alphaproteobacteria bacterium]|nr:hypothetical protein [Alphaproteobacteria bacterium]
MKILDITKLYNTFQNDVGNFLDASIDQNIITLFSESFKKTANGAPLVARRSDLKEQLFTIRQQAGKWIIDVKEILEFTDPHRCLNRYHLKSANIGTFDVVAMVRMNSIGLIEEIDEVYYQIPQS